MDFLLNKESFVISMVFLNYVDGSIDMVVYKVEGPRSNFVGISSISSMGNPRDIETETKADSQSNINIEVVNNIDVFCHCV